MGEPTPNCGQPPHDKRVLDTCAAPCCANQLQRRDTPKDALRAQGPDPSNFASGSRPERRQAVAAGRTHPDSRHLAVDSLPVSGSRASSATGPLVITLHRVEGIDDQRVDGRPGRILSNRLQRPRKSQPYPLRVVMRLLKIADRSDPPRPDAQHIQLFDRAAGILLPRPRSELAAARRRRQGRASLSPLHAPTISSPRLYGVEHGGSLIGLGREQGF